jgi:hypothetical protein
LNVFKTEMLIRLAGLGQLALVLASTAIPRVLRWREELAVIGPLTRRVFWTYAAYILGTNAFFGIASAVAPGALVDRSYAAFALTAFMAVYWLGRIVVQFVWFRNAAPAGRRFVYAEAALVSGFVFFAAVYTRAAWLNYAP